MVPAAIYRAFLLPSGLEVDLGFTPADQFGPVGQQAQRLEQPIRELADLAELPRGRRLSP
jgi:hypothetical protein